MRHFALGHRRFSRSAFAGSGACGSPYRQRRLSVPSARKGHILARSVAAFGSRLPLRRRGCLSPFHRLAAWRSGWCRAGRVSGFRCRGVGCRSAFSALSQRRAACAARLVRRRVAAVRCRVGPRSSSSGAPALSASVSRRAAVLPLGASRFVGGVAPTNRSSGPAQKAAQAAQLKRSASSFTISYGAA